MVQFWLQGPMMHGYRTNLWTTARIAEMIGHEFGVQYHRDRVGRLMHSLNWSPQKPERRALERNDQAIEHWKQKRWPRIKKRCAVGCLPSFRRRVGLSLDPARSPDVVSARMHSGALSSPGRRDKVSVISGISVSPRRQRLGLYYQVYFDNIGQQEVCLFLRELLRHVRGPLIVLLDNSSTHQGQPLRQLLQHLPPCASSTFPPMLRSCIPMKEFGLSRNAPSPIVVPMIWRNWSMTSSTRSIGFVTQLTNCAEASCNPNCLPFCARLSLCRDQIRERSKNTEKLYSQLRN